MTDPVLVAVEHSDAVGLEGVPHVQRVVVVAAEQDAPGGTVTILSTQISLWGTMVARWL